MNIGQAKAIDLVAFLAKLGFEPTRRKNSELWYLSPLRTEDTPSFKLNQTLNSWYDFGEGYGGDIIDFVKRYDKLNSTSDALSRIESLVGRDMPPPSMPVPKYERPAEPKIALDEIGPVKSNALISYLKRRGIDSKMVKDHVFEAQYTIGKHSYYGLAFPSDSGGTEIRNPMF